jgi:two-component system chemotaxis response regulator CheY
MVMKALVVDDSRAIRSVISRMLRDNGHSVTEAANGQDALDQLKIMPSPPDLALLDWNMPVMDGYTLLCNIRNDVRYANTVVMMVTTETELERMQMALAAGANEYLMKPFTPEALGEKMAVLGLALKGE